MARPPRPPLTAASIPLEPPPDLTSRLDALGVQLDDAAIAKLGDFLGRLLAMNTQMNLTSVRDPADAWERHVLDSLTLLPCLSEVAAGARLADVGSGGGLPGIPLAIARPDLSVTLVESTRKKAAFLKAVCADLELPRVTVLAERAEHVAAGERGGTFDAVTARAVAKLSQLVPWTVPLARSGGLVLLIKGQRAEEELAEAKAALLRHGATHRETIRTPTGRVVVLTRAR